MTAARCDLPQVQRNVGPGALLRLIGGALRLNGDTFRNAVSAVAETRLHLAIVAVASLSNGVASAMDAVASGVLAQSDAALYRLLVLIGVAEIVVQFVFFVAAVHLLRLLTRRPPLTLSALFRLLALSLAPVCLLILGPMFGLPDWVRGGLIAWRIIISVVGLRVGSESSWLGAALTVLAADLISSPVVHLALFGVGASPPGGPLLPA